MEDEFASVVDAFCSQAQEVWPQAAAALADGEHESLERIAHAMKGSALSLGAEPLSETLQALEQAARGEDVALTREQHQLAQARLDETLSWVQSAMA